ADLTYDARTWRDVEPFRPHLVRREARLALLRVPFSRSFEALLLALRDGTSPPARRAVAARLAATLAARDSVAAFHRFRLQDAAWASLIDDDESPDVRAAAADVLSALLDADRETTLPEPKLAALLERVEPDTEDDLLLA